MRTEYRAKATGNRGMNMAMGCLLCGLLAGDIGLVQQAGAAQDEKPTVLVSLAQINSEVRTLRENLARTIAGLEELKAAAGNNGELGKPYANFSSAYTELEAQVTMLRLHGTATRARAKEHWDAWQKELTEMQNPKLREKAQKRYTAASGEFEKITKKVEAAKDGFAPLAADLKDINIYLKTDLTKEAVSSLSNTIWKMGGTAKSADGKLADVNEQIERTMKKMPQL